MALSAVLILAWFSRPAADPDMWWHLKTGQYIVEHRQLPIPDRFAFTTYMRPPTLEGETLARDFNLTHEWLAQILMYQVYAAVGFPGLVLLRALSFTLLCGILGWIVYRRTGGPYRAAAAALFAAFVMREYAADRPFLATYLMLVVTLAAVEYRRLLWLLPPLYAVWSNCHSGYFMGWVVLGAYCGESLVKRWRGQPDPGERRLWLVTGACILASGLNPNGFRALQILLIYQNSPMQSHIAEWQHTVYWNVAPFTVAMYGAAVVMLWAWRRVRLAEWVIFAVFALSAITAVRNVPLMALLGPIMIFVYARWPGKIPVATAWLAPVLLLVTTGWAVAKGSAFQLRADEETYPAGAADFLLQHHVTGRLLNTYVNGGYLIWRLWPQNQVFMDGRALNEAVWQEYNRIILNADSKGAASGEDLLKSYNVDAIVMDGIAPDGTIYLLPAALADPVQKEWKLVYRDSHALVFMRQPPPGVQPIFPLQALQTMESHCELRMDHGSTACAASLGVLFKRIGDPVRALRWFSAFKRENPGKDPKVDPMLDELVKGAVGAPRR